MHSIAEFKGKKGRSGRKKKYAPDAPKKMTRAGAWTRIATVAGMGGIGYGVAGKVLANNLIKDKPKVFKGINALNKIARRKITTRTALAGAAILGAGSYLEHKHSKYSPIGKQKWKDYKSEPKLYGIPVQKLALIKGLK